MASRLAGSFPKASSISTGSHDKYQPLAPFSKNTLESIKGAIGLTLRLARPYAAIATVLGILSSSLLAVENLSDLSSVFFIGLSQHTTANFCMLLYQAALNELADIEIDKINKPHHPLASGQYSQRLAVVLAASYLLMSVVIGCFVGSWPMRLGLLTLFLLGTTYSVNLPYMRWKRFTSLTLICTVVQPLVANSFATFLHIKTHVLKSAVIYPRSMIFTFMIIPVYWAIIAVFKDITDIEGDKAGGIYTLASRLGPQRVFWLCVSLLEMSYGVAILIGITYPSLGSKILMVSGHAIMGLVFWYNAKSVNVKSKAAVQSLYMIIFELLCVEYIIIAFAR